MFLGCDPRFGAPRQSAIAKKLQYGPKICFCASEVVLRRSWGGKGCTLRAGAVRRLSVASRGHGAGFRVRRRCQAVACDIGGNGALCRRGRCDLLRRSYCENEKSPIVGALRVRWDSKRISFWSCDRFHATASSPGGSGLWPDSAWTSGHDRLQPVALGSWLRWASSPLCRSAR